MRHRIKGRKLSRTASHRKATLQSLAMALIKEHRIVTTLAKAKELRGFVEPLITRAKIDTHHNRNQVFSSLQNKEAVSSLFSEIGPKSKDRAGGYTRVIKAGFRQGDGAELAVIELVDYNDVQPEGTKTSTKKRTRRAGKSNTPTQASKPEVEKGAKTPKAEKMDDQPATDENKNAVKAEEAPEGSDSATETSEEETEK